MESEGSAQGDPATITGCHHVAVCVRDIDEARRFYGGVLSLTELERPREIASKFRSAWYSIGPSELHVVENPEFQPLDSPLAPHIAVAASDFRALTAQIADRGGVFAFGPGSGLDAIERAIIKDPTGNILEIIAAPLRS